MAKTEDILARYAGLAEGVFPYGTGAGSLRDAAVYLAHTERGESLSALADATGTHPSTAMRAVRRVEAGRDDPLVDSIIGSIEGNAVAASLAPDELEREARRYLRRLSEPGSFLLVAADAAKGGIFCKANGFSKPIAMMPAAVSVEFLREGWIRAIQRGGASIRYRITADGRSVLKRLIAEEALKRLPPSGFAEGQTPFRAQHQIAGERLVVDPASGETRALAVNLGEDPLGWLARRKGPDGAPFLAAVEFEAGERLRQDFEAAQMGPSVAQDWRKFLTPGDRLSGTPVARGPAEGPMAARDRVARALGSLGPGLSDAALRVCCFLEGLEACERRMGWSARSGKVVLKIALQRLAQHYGLSGIGR